MTYKRRLQLNPKQLRLVQTAVSKAGLRDRGQYYLLLRQYKQPDGSAVTSSKQLNNSQLDDILAICESFGWRMPGKTETYYRDRVANAGNSASFAQQAAIERLRGDLGWNDLQLNGMIRRMTHDQISSVVKLSPRQAYIMIESMKEMFGRKTGRHYNDLTDVQIDMEAKDGKDQTDQEIPHTCDYELAGR